MPAAPAITIHRIFMVDITILTRPPMATTPTIPTPEPTATEARPTARTAARTGEPPTTRTLGRTLAERRHPRHTARSVGQAYNPYTGAYGATHQGSNAYGSWGQSVVSKNGNTAYTQHAKCLRLSRNGADIGGRQGCSHQHCLRQYRGRKNLQRRHVCRPRWQRLQEHRLRLAEVRQWQLERRAKADHNFGTELQPATSHEQQSEHRVGAAEGPEQPKLFGRPAEGPELQPAASIGVERVQAEWRIVLGGLTTGSTKPPARCTAKPALLAVPALGWRRPQRRRRFWRWQTEMSGTARVTVEFNHDELGIRCPKWTTDWIPEPQTSVTRGTTMRNKCVVERRRSAWDWWVAFGVRYRAGTGCNHQLHAWDGFYQISHLQVGHNRRCRVPKPDRRRTDQRCCGFSIGGERLNQTDGDKAELYVGYQASIDQERQWTRMAWVGGLRWGGMANAQSSTINIGTLVLDMYDPSNKQLVWTGRATKTLDASVNQEKNKRT